MLRLPFEVIISHKSHTGGTVINDQKYFQAASFGKGKPEQDAGFRNCVPSVHQAISRLHSPWKTSDHLSLKLSSPQESPYVVVMAFFPLLSPR